MIEAAARARKTIGFLQDCLEETSTLVDQVNDIPFCDAEGNPPDLSSVRDGLYDLRSHGAQMGIMSRESKDQLWERVRDA